MKKLELIQKKQEQKREANQQVKMNAPATSKTENRCNENYNNNPNENHVTSDTISDAADEIKKGKNDMTVIIITHNQAITPMADRIIQVKNGMIEKNEINDNPIPIENIEW